MVCSKGLKWVSKVAAGVALALLGLLLCAWAVAAWAPASDTSLAPSAEGAMGTAGGIALPDPEPSSTPLIEQLPPAQTHYAVGEYVRYELRVTLPEGVTAGLVISDDLPSGLAYVNHQVITTTVESGFLTADFAGSVPTPALTAPGGSGGNVTLTFGDITSAEDGLPENDRLIVRITAVLLNEAANQDGAALINAAQLRYADPDTGDPITGAAPQAVQIMLVEPQLELHQSILLPADPPDAGGVVTYRTLVHHAVSSHSAAWDVVITDTLPAGIASFDNVVVTATGIAPPSYEVVGGQLRLPSVAEGSFDLPMGAAITVTCDGLIAATAQPVQTITNTGHTAWSSIDGAAAEKRTGATDDLGGALNDYRAGASASFTTDDLAVAKTLFSTTLTQTTGVQVTIGEVILFQVAITLPEGTLPGLVLTDAIPAGMACVPGAALVDTAAFAGALSPGDPVVACLGADGADLTATFGAITVTDDNDAANNRLNLHLPMRVLDVPGNVGVPPQASLVNSAVAQVTGGPVHDAGSVALSVVEPRLVIVKTVAPPQAAANDPVTMTLAVSNTGLSTAYDVILEDMLPETSFADASEGVTPPGFAYAATPVTGGLRIRYAGDVLPPGQSATLRFQATLAAGVAQGQVLTNTAVVTQATTFPGVEADERNEPAVSANAALTVIAPDLSVLKSDGRATATPALALTYVITVTNQGARDAFGVAVTDTLPANVVYTPASATHGGSYQAASRQVVWAVGALAAGQTITRSYSAIVVASLPAGVNAITNTVAVAEDHAHGADPTPANNSAQDVDALDATPDLILAKSDGEATVRPGAALTYVLTISNAGHQDATGVRVTDTLPAHVAYVSASDGGSYVSSQVAWLVGALAAGQTITRSVTVLVDVPLPAGVVAITNIAVVADDGANGADPTPANNSAADVDALDAAPDLVLAKSDGQVTVQPGDVLTYVLTIANVGDQGATGVRVTDTLPAHVNYVSASDGGSYASGQLAWPVGALAAGQTITRSVAVTVDAPAPVGVIQLVNVAVVADDGANGADPTPGDNSAQDVDALDAAPDLTIAKSDGQTSARPGEALTYVLSIANVGDQGATGVGVTDTLPTHASYVAGSASDGGSYTSGRVTWTIGALGAGQTVTRSYRVRVADPVPAGVAQLVNAAAVADDGANGADPTLANNTAQDADALDAAPDLTIAKSDGVVSAQPGDVLTYTLTLANVGDQGATGVRVTDTLPSYVSYRSSSAGGLYASGQVTWQVGALGAGQTLTRSVSVTVAASVPAGAMQLVNLAQVADDGANGADPTPGDNMATDADALDALAVLEASKTATLWEDADQDGLVSPGDRLRYTVAITNAGDREATGVALSDAPGAYTTLAAGSVAASPGVTVTSGNGHDDTEVLAAIGSLPGAGGSVTVTFEVVLIYPAPLGVTGVVNQALIRADGLDDLPSDDPSTPAPGDPTVTPIFAQPRLEATKGVVVYQDLDGNGVVSPGDVLQYTVRITNRGNGAAQSLAFWDLVDPNTTLIAGSVTASRGAVTVGNAPGDASVGVAIGDLPGGDAYATLRFRVTIHSPLPEDAIEIVNQGHVAGENVAEQLTDDPATPAPDDPTGIVAYRAPIISALKGAMLYADTDSSGMPSRGDTLQYTVRITNSGVGSAVGVVFSDTLDPNTALVVGSVYASQGSILRGNASGDAAIEVALDVIPIGASVEIRYRATVKMLIPAGVTTVSNQGRVSGENMSTALTDDPATPTEGDRTVTVISPPTSVDLLYLLALPLNLQQAQILWATAVEVDSMGFNLYRAATADWEEAAWVAWLPTQAQGGSGAVYAYTDPLPYAGAWWYWIEDVHSQGGAVRHGPVQAIAARTMLRLPMLAR